MDPTDPRDPTYNGPSPMGTLLLPPPPGPTRESSPRPKRKRKAKVEKVPTELPTAKQSNMRRFVLERSEDATGTSGTGIVAEGIEFSNGRCVIHWMSQLDSVNVYDNAKVLETLHGHDGRTEVRWLDE